MDARDPPLTFPRHVLIYLLAHEQISPAGVALGAVKSTTRRRYARPHVSNLTPTISPNKEAKCRRSRR